MFKVCRKWEKVHPPFTDGAFRFPKRAAAARRGRRAGAWPARTSVRRSGRRPGHAGIRRRTRHGRDRGPGPKTRRSCRKAGRRCRRARGRGCRSGFGAPGHPVRRRWCRPPLRRGCSGGLLQTRAPFPRDGPGPPIRISIKAGPSRRDGALRRAGPASNRARKGAAGCARCSLTRPRRAEAGVFASFAARRTASTFLGNRSERPQPTTHAEARERSAPASKNPVFG